MYERINTSKHGTGLNLILPREKIMQIPHVKNNVQVCFLMTSTRSVVEGLYNIECAGTVGELTMALSDLLWEDMVAGPEPQRLKVPY